MHSEFSTMAKSARERIPVPNVPMNGIRGRSRALGNQYRLRMVVAGTAMALAVGAGAVGPRLYDGIQFWFSGNRWAVRVHSMAIVSPPSIDDLRAITSTATFPVVYPIGLPNGTHIIRIIYSPADHPTSITMQYLNANAGFDAGFTLVDSRIINATALPAGPQPPSANLHQWRTGGETVIDFDSKKPVTLSHRIQSAMQSTTPAQSLAAAEAMLWKTRLLNGTWRFADVADRLAGDRSGVLIGRGDLRLIPALARWRKPLAAARATYLTNIPYVKGEPQYNRADMRFDRDVAVPVGGVQAIAAVMAAAGESGRWTDCCEILYTAPVNGSYSLWTLPMAQSKAVVKYLVDARTFRVQRP